MATFNTKFDKGDKVIYINEYSEIIRRKVVGIVIENNNISYRILEYKAATSLDKDKIILKNEDECFANMKELVEYYEPKLD